MDDSEERLLLVSRHFDLRSLRNAGLIGPGERDEVAPLPCGQKADSDRRRYTEVVRDFVSGTDGVNAVVVNRELPGAAVRLFEVEDQSRW